MDNLDKTKKIEYYQQLRDVYCSFLKNEKKLEFFRRVGKKLEILDIVFFISVSSQVIPMFIVGRLPERMRAIGFGKFSIPTILIVTIVLFALALFLFDLNRSKLVYAGYGRKASGKLPPLQQMFMAAQFCLDKLKTFCEVNDGASFDEAKKHFDVFRFQFPSGIWATWADEFLSDHDFFNDKFRNNKIPWLELSDDQENIIKGFRRFFKSADQRFEKKDKLEQLIPPLENLSMAYFCYIKDKEKAGQYLSDFGSSMLCRL